MPVARLLIDAPCSGPWNMGVDQALLESADASGIMTVRFYSWEPTLSLGYFQELHSRGGHAASLGCPLVRRTTGGGAILHDQEITYSLAIPSENRWAKGHEQLYWTMHRCIVDVLREFHVDAGLFKDPECGGAVQTTHPITGNAAADKTFGCGSGVSAESVADGKHDPNSFLCFERRTPGDIVLSGYKIGGSAQRRKRNAILQHGSLLLRRSTFAPELPGIADLGGIADLDQSKFQKRWIEVLEASLQIELASEPMKDSEADRADHLEQIFRSVQWNGKTEKFLI